MSLREAVLDIAEMAEEEAKCRDGDMRQILNMIGKMIRNAAKAAGDPPSIAVPPEVQHFQMMQKAREEFRKDKNKEDDGTKMVLLVGGASDGDSFAILSNWPVGARTNISGEVYQLKEDGKLHFEGKRIAESR